MKPFGVTEIGLAASITLNVLFIAAALFVRYGYSSPVESDARHYFIFKAGQTMPGRSIDFAGNGWSFRVTRIDSYRTPDWKPKHN